jgi:Ca2+-binding RTX toxin-like protein
MLANDVALVTFSDEVYRPDGGVAPTGQWERLGTTQTLLGASGPYFAAAWYNSATRELVLAHRGTEPNSWADWQTDAVIIAGIANPQIPSAERFREEALRAVETSNRTVSQITHTGHSLGGSIAQVMAARRADERAVTFNPLDGGQVLSAYGLDPGATYANIRNVRSWFDPAAVVGAAIGTTQRMPVSSYPNIPDASESVATAFFLGLGAMFFSFTGIALGLGNLGYFRLTQHSITALRQVIEAAGGVVDTPVPVPDDNWEDFQKFFQADAGTAAIATGVEYSLDPVLSPAQIRVEITSGSDDSRRMVGTSLNDFIAGGDGADHLFGNEGTDLLYAGLGADRLDGGSGNDVVFGGDGNDVLDGGVGADLLFGGEGADLYALDTEAGEDSITDTQGVNRLTLGGRGAGGAYFEGGANGWRSADGHFGVEVEGERVVVTRSGARVALEAFVDGQFGIRLFDQRPTPGGQAIVGDLDFEGVGDYSDTLNGTAIGETIQAGAGFDRVTAGGGADVAFGGDETDQIYGGAGNDWLYGGGDAAVADVIGQLGTGGGVRGDWLGGNEDDDVLVGTALDDVLSGGGGGDVLVGGAGRDFIFGDADYAARSFAWTLTVSADGRTNLAGNAALDNPATSSADIIYAGAGNDYVSAGHGDDYVFGDDGDDLIYGNAGADTLFGGRGRDILHAAAPTDILDSSADFLDGGEDDDLLYGGDGGNILLGGAGNDTIYSRGGDDHIDGGDGDDTIYASIGADVVYGGAGNDRITAYSTVSLVLDGGDGDDFLQADLADDVLRGGAGRDTLIGNAGADLLDGGIGDDTYLFARGFGRDLVLDIDPTAGNHDRIVFTDLASNEVSAIKLAGRLALQVAGTTDLLEVEWSPGTGAGIESVAFSDGVSWDEQAIEALVQPTNSAPRVLNALPDVTTAEDALFALMIPAGTFIDIDAGDTLRYAATLEGGGSLPDWLRFDEATGTFEGTPGNEAVGTFSVVVRAIDGAGAAAADGFALTVLNENDAPEVAAPLADVSGREGYPIEVEVPQGTFRDIDAADQLTLSAQLTNGSTLPSWLTFDAEGRLFRGSTTRADIGAYSVRLSAADIAGASVWDDFVVTIAAVPGLTLTGGSGSDTLVGDAGDDQLYSGPGGDTLDGGAGNDTYWITDWNTSTVDIVSTDQGAGKLDVVRWDVDAGKVYLRRTEDHLVLFEVQSGDTVRVLNFFGTLAPTRIEEFRFAGDVVWTGANVASRILIGTAGADTLTGTAAGETIAGMAGADILSGGDGPDWIEGGEGDDTLSAGIGASYLYGGPGNDTYLVESAAIVEYEGEGFDTLRSSRDTTLPDHVERLELTGAGPVRGYGNAAPNELVGNGAANVLHGYAGDDLLDGGAGADTMAGGPGDDTYESDVAGDIITESPNEGIDTVRSAVSRTLGGDLENLTLTGTGAINGTGNALDNVLIGNTAANTLNGGAGADTLRGGPGNDTYVVDDLDTVIENADEGSDLVRSATSYRLPANVERLTLTGAGSANATGNALNNTLTGNAGDNILDGGPGADRMSGGAGNDTYYVDDAGDRVTESSATGGHDVVHASVTFTLGTNVEDLTLTGTAGVNGTGNALANVLRGNAGANALNGGAGADTMIGGAGDDAYTVDNAGDIVLEVAGEGVDTIRSSVSYAASDHVENLVLIGTGAIDATGNVLANVLTGNSANNMLTGGDGDDYLDGLGGADTMIGGLGNDTYVVGQSADMTIESAGEGADTVRSSITWTLGSEVEDLILTGSTAINGSGNALDNVLTGNAGKNSLAGNAGADTLDGGAGADTLTGGTGNDTYRLARGYGADTVVENDATAGNSDIAQFLAGVVREQVWFLKAGNNLEASIIGTSDKLIVKDWYLGSQYRTEQFRTTDDAKTLLAANVQNLVNAMAAFSPPAAGQTTLPTAYESALLPLMAANWT